MDGECIETLLANNSYNIYFRNAIKCADSMKGHGRGGVCFLINKSIKKQPKFHSNGISQLNIKGTSIFGVYLPCNKKENESIYRVELLLLKDLISKSIRDNMDILATGDFNVDFQKKPNLRNKLLINLMIDLNLVSWDMIYCGNKAYTYFKDEDLTHIDHVIGNSDNKNIDKIIIFDDTSLNKSDHFGLIIKFNVRDNPNFTYTIIQEDKINYYWNMQHFKDKFDVKMMETSQKWLPQFRKLEDPSMSQIIRNEKLENLFEILHTDIKDTADSCGDIIKEKIDNGKIKNKPWWNDKIIELQKESNRLHKRYLDTNNDYYEINSKLIDRNIREKIREAESKYKKQEHWDLNKLRFCETKKFWTIIDNKINKKCICDTDLEETKNEFSKTFNQKLVTSDDCNEKILINDFLESTKNTIYTEDINEYEIRDILKELENGKSVGHRQVSNEMYKYSKNSYLANIIVIIIGLLINFGCIFKFLNTSIIKPIVKDIKKGTDQVNNIRPISVSDVFHTVMEKWLLRRILETYSHCAKQFGFRRGHSCQHAITTVLETIKSAKRKRKRVFLCLIDASKAFDKLNRLKLWTMMLKFCKPSVLRYLIQYYENSYAYVDMRGNKSDKFKTTLGVKQGGCLSPLLYAIYVSDISEIIDKLNIGVKVGSQLVNLIMYADDMALLAENKKDMNTLLNVLTEYGHNKEIKFNGAKTNLLIFNKKVKKLGKKLALDEDKLTLKLDNEPLVEVSEAKYLGFHLSTINFNTHHLENRLESFALKTMKLNKLDFDKDEMPSSTKSLLYKTHVRPVLFYGIDCISLKQKQVDNLYTTEGNMIKLAHNLYTGIKSTELFLAMGMDVTANVLKLNKLKLFLRLYSCNYTFDLLQSIINEHTVYQVKDSIINEIMDITKCNSMSLETLHEQSKIHISNIVKGFKNEKKENETVVNIKNLLNNLPKNKIKIENILKAYDYEYINESNDETIDIGDLYWDENRN